MCNHKSGINCEVLSYIACCGCYCKTCRAFVNKSCKGCKLGYYTGERDINRAKCKIKLCCFKDKKMETCAECEEYLVCEVIQSRFKGYQYRKSVKILEYIKKQGYAKFIKKADEWRDCYGKLE